MIAKPSDHGFLLLAPQQLKAVKIKEHLHVAHGISPIVTIPGSPMPIGALTTMLSHSGSKLGNMSSSALTYRRR